MYKYLNRCFGKLRFSCNKLKQNETKVPTFLYLCYYNETFLWTSWHVELELFTHGIACEVIATFVVILLNVMVDWEVFVCIESRWHNNVYYLHLCNYLKEYYTYWVSIVSHGPIFILQTYSTRVCIKYSKYVGMYTSFLIWAFIMKLINLN